MKNNAMHTILLKDVKAYSSIDVQIFFNDFVMQTVAKTVATVGREAGSFRSIAAANSLPSPKLKFITISNAYW